MNDGYFAFQKFVAIKLHFDPNTDYNYFSTNGAVKSSLASFTGRKDRNLFYRLAKICDFDKDKIEGYIFTNLVVNHNLWIKSLISSQCEEQYRKHIRYVQRNPLNMFMNDLKDLHGDYPLLSDLVSVSSTGPILLTQVFSGITFPETMYLVARAIPGLYDAWQKKVTEIDDSLRFIVHDPFYRYRMYYDFLHKSLHHLTTKEIRDTLREVYLV